MNEFDSAMGQELCDMIANALDGQDYGPLSKEQIKELCTGLKNVLECRNDWLNR